MSDEAREVPTEDEIARAQVQANAENKLRNKASEHPHLADQILAGIPSASDKAAKELDQEVAQRKEAEKSAENNRKWQEIADGYIQRILSVAGSVLSGVTTSENAGIYGDVGRVELPGLPGERGIRPVRFLGAEVTDQIQKSVKEGVIRGLGINPEEINSRGFDLDRDGKWGMGQFPSFARLSSEFNGVNPEIKRNALRQVYSIEQFPVGDGIVLNRVISPFPSERDVLLYKFGRAENSEVGSSPASDTKAA